jgi:hypothetical protein
VAYEGDGDCEEGDGDCEEGQRHADWEEGWGRGHVDSLLMGPLLDYSRLGVVADGGFPSNG